MSRVTTRLIKYAGKPPQPTKPTSHSFQAPPRRQPADQVKQSRNRSTSVGCFLFVVGNHCTPIALLQDDCSSVAVRGICLASCVAGPFPSLVIRLELPGPNRTFHGAAEREANELLGVVSQ